MHQLLITAEKLIWFQQALRYRAGKLIRAKPYRDIDGKDCYRLFYVCDTAIMIS